MGASPLAVDACSVSHVGDRRDQQDRVGLFRHPKLRGIALAVVADGMGGHTGGATAAEQVVLTAKNSLEQYSPREDDPQQMLRACLEEAHVLIRGGRYVNEQEPHSTGVVLLVEPQRVSWAHCGDSRLLRMREGRCLLRTRDHSWIEELTRNGNASPEQVANYPNRNVLWTSLGGGVPPQIDLGQAADLAAGDVFVLCSDGLWEYFDDHELAMLACAGSAREASSEIFRIARQRAAGAGDNLSLLMLRFVE